MDELAFLSDLGFVFRVSHGQTNVGDVKINSTVPSVTFDDDCRHVVWDSWSERCDTTAYYVEVLTDSTVKTVTEMLSIVSGAFSAIGKLGEVVRVGGKVVDTASDVGTDSGLAALLGELFDEHKVLFTIELGIKTENLQTARQHHLRSYVKE